MDQSKLKSYAPQARLDFIAAVVERAAFYGLTQKGIEPIVAKGDVIIIGENAFSRDVAVKRQVLEERIQRDGFQQTMEAMAYSWFNRFAATRYMELHGYLGHGYRVLSHPEGQEHPEILDHATDLDLPGLDRNKAVDLKLEGNKDEELYRLLLIAQCNALHKAMPFLFEEIGDATELLLPINLLHTDSLIRRLVESIEESAWDEIEIIGWLYQFYISEKKDQVIGKVVKSEDIPAATQLFTPNWIVKYMVQNSLGAQWLATYPDSKLKGEMEYYIEPAEQTDDVKAQLAAITPSQLNPEELTLIDPASGSGHILVEAYELFKAIYLERGYRQRDIPQLILEKNLFGLDIDERAAQLSGFALMMKGRADDRRLFERGVKLNVMALQDSMNFDAERLAQGVKLADYGLKAEGLTELKRLFEYATIFGSLIQVPERLASSLPALKQLSETVSQDLFVSEALKRLRPLVQQAELLAAQFDAVVANPPYMGSKFYCKALKDKVNTAFKAGKADLYGVFTLRNMLLAKDSGHVGMITIPNWMFLSSFEDLRDVILRDAPISSLVHNGRGVWGSDFGSCSYVLRRSSPGDLVGRFLRLFDRQGSVATNEELEIRFHDNPRFSVSNTEFKTIPGSPIAYWISSSFRETFDKNMSLSDVLSLKAGMSTGNNELFQRLWSEVDLRRLTLNFPEIQAKWVPCNSGGDFRKWYGNNGVVVDWEDEGAEIRSYRNSKGAIASAVRNTKYYFRSGITWSKISVSMFAARWMEHGFVFDDTGRSGFVDRNDVESENVLAAMVSGFANQALRVLAPTVSFTSGELEKLPVTLLDDNRIKRQAQLAIKHARVDWNAYERSWDFHSLPLLTAPTDPMPTLECSYTAWTRKNCDIIAEMKRLEEENNRLFIDAYGLSDELTPEVPIEQITLTVNPSYRYGGKLTEEELWARFRQDTMEELVSYAIGCMMGRYSLDESGLIYAHSGNEGFDSSSYSSFPADDDGIIPLTDTEWFDDDAANRLVNFMSVAWDPANLEENLKYLANNLSTKKNEANRETIRRYLCDKFFKNHLQTYKNRPIYWLFSSGKQKAFQCLVYLHRYNEGTLARMRTEYVVPLQGMMASRIRQLDGDITAADSTVHRKRLEKERSTLVKQQSELQDYDEKLRHYADQRIALDLDDGVKVNYGKFSSLLAEVKKVTGEKPD